MENPQKVGWVAAAGWCVNIAYLIDRRQTVENAKHELGVACVVVRLLDTESIHQHLIQRTSAQWVWQLAKVVF